MIRLKPFIEIPARECPNCSSTLAAKDFLIVGMRSLADFECRNCAGRYYGDLPAGQALYTPALLDANTGAVSGGAGAEWFSEWLRESFAGRTGEPIGFETRAFSKLKSKVILLNCLDALYGHSLLKLLNAQHYIDFHTDASLIIMLPAFLEWMLPGGAAEAWIIDLPLARGTVWNNWLAAEIGGRLESFDEVFLSVAFSHPHPKDYDIERFTKIAPFPLGNFAESGNRPVVTFIWREDRLWETENAATTKSARFGKIKKRFGARQKNQIGEQIRKVTEFAEAVRRDFPALDFAVVGLGESGEFPEWIRDLRLTELSDETERTWCARYAVSHIVVGVHGSNMLLPSAHAGALIELIGEERRGNFLQDVLFRGDDDDAREMFFRYRFEPLSATPDSLARLACLVLRYEEFRRLMSPEFCRHAENYNYTDFNLSAGQK